jgi:hypothetical protein
MYVYLQVLVHVHVVTYYFLHPSSTDLDDGEVDVPMMPSAEDILRAQEECARLGVEAYHADAHLSDEEEDEEEEGKAAAGRDGDHRNASGAVSFMNHTVCYFPMLRIVFHPSLL